VTWLSRTLDARLPHEALPSSSHDSVASASTVIEGQEHGDPERGDPELVAIVARVREQFSSPRLSDAGERRVRRTTTVDFGV